MDIFFRIITELGSVWTALLVGVLVLVFLGLREGVRFGFVVGGAVSFGWVLKQIVAKPRPDVENALVQASGYSFPSNHTIIATVLALYVFFAFVRWSRFSTVSKVVASVGLAIAAVLVGWSRVYLGVHFWEDVFAGAILGATFYFALPLLFDKVFKEKLSRKCKTLRETKWLARALVRALRRRRHAVMLFEGALGAGKTTFIREVVKGLGVRVPATSPTFSIINKYRENVFHVDLYRVESESELQNTDFYEIINYPVGFAATPSQVKGNYVFIEWSEKFDIDYPAGAIRVKIKVEEDGSRVFDITC